MVMMGQQLTGKLPFRTVYLHAMVRDKEGRKMSKSKGNVIDPMEVIYGCDLETLHQKVRDGNLPAKEVELAIKGQRENFPDGLPECGADALRFGLLAYTVQGRDINLDVGRVVGYRQFCNKLWNATRFALTHLAPDRYAPAPLLDAVDELLASPSLAARDRWILSRLSACCSAVDAAMRAYSFAAAANAVYAFFLYELCDYYLELIKPLMQPGHECAALAAADAGGDVALAQRLARRTLHVCLELGFRLLHPMMPLVTEELWQRLPGRGVLPLRAAPGAPADWPSIVIAAYPVEMPGAARPDVEAAFALFQELLRAGRALRADAEIAPSRFATFYFAVAEADAATRAVVEAHRCDLMTLLRCDSLRLVARREEAEEGCSAAVVSERASVHLLLRGLIDPAAEVAKLERKAERLAKEAEILQRRAAAPGYEAKVPAAVRAQNAEALARLQHEREVLGALQQQYRAWGAQGEAAAAAAPPT
jgi:valyl-tRNA synthetase